MHDIKSFHISERFFVFLLGVFRFSWFLVRRDAIVMEVDGLGLASVSHVDGDAMFTVEYLAKPTGKIVKEFKIRQNGKARREKEEREKETDSGEGRRRKGK